MQLRCWTRMVLVGLCALLAIACGEEAAPEPGREAGAANAEQASSEEPFVIGALDSLTGVGESYGVPLSRSKLLAVEEINAAGGVNGRMLQLVIEDSKCTSTDAIAAYQRLTDVEGIKIVLGATCSGATLGVAPLAEKDGVILFSPSSTSPDITHAGDYVFRTAISSQKAGTDVGNLLWADGVRTIVTISEATDYAEGSRRAAVAQFEQLGGTVAAAESYPSDAIDFRSQLAKLLRVDAEAMFLAAQGEISGGTIIKQARELGYDGPIYSEVVPTGPNALEIAGEHATGLKAIVPDPELNTSTGTNFLAHFNSRFGVAPWPWYQGSAYDGVYIAAECLRQTNDDQDTDGFRDCLHGLTWSGAIGDDYSFDENGDVAGISHVLIEVLPVAERTEANLGYRVVRARAAS
ncbi:MAG: ABC transporter substrate-binding protein [Chloroflexi bacterium]|nr:ABC transporter substrate-binding protein [Chloroflexota bacterium]